MDRDAGTHDKPGDWDSLSDRMRKARRHQRAMQHKQQQMLLLAHKQSHGAANPAGTPGASAAAAAAATTTTDRKDALTERPLDFDREEQTRKGETIKWLENHFGSELSTSSSSSSGDRPAAGGHHAAGSTGDTKKTFFNVTIKSNPNASAPTAPVKAAPATHQAVQQTATLERFRHHNRQVHRQHFGGGSREDLLAINQPVAVQPLSNHRRPTVNSSMIDLRQVPSSATSANAYNNDSQHHHYHPQPAVTRATRAHSVDPIHSAANSTKLSTPLSHKEDLGYLSGSRNDVRPAAAQNLQVLRCFQ